MTLREATKILIEFQAWRRGADTKQLAPKVIGEALDSAINILRDITNE